MTSLGKPILVVIRGDSGSGKSTVARALRHRFVKGECAVVAQDNIRRTILRERDEPGAFNIALIELIASECLARGRVTIVEGILDAGHYAGMLERLAPTAAGGAFFYAFELSFEETVARHLTRPEAAEFTPDHMRGWYRGRQPLHFTTETIFDASLSVDAVVERIYADLRQAWSADEGAIERYDRL